MKSNVGLSIFAWKSPLGGDSSILAPSTDFFTDSPILNGRFMELKVACSVDNSWITRSFDIQRYAFDTYLLCIHWLR